MRPRVPTPGVPFSDWERSYDRATREMFDRLVEALAAPTGVQVEAVTLTGHTPAPALVEFANAWGADLVACATHGHGFLTRLVLGSVAAELLRTAPCSLLCVPAAVPPHHAATIAEETGLLRDDVPSVQWELTVRDFAARFRGRACKVSTADEHGAVRDGPKFGLLTDARYAPDGRIVRVALGSPGDRDTPCSVKITDVRGLERLAAASGAERGLRVLGAERAFELRVL